MQTHNSTEICMCQCCVNTEKVPNELSDLFTFFFLFYNSTGYGECLLDKPSGGTYDLSSQLPGSVYDVNKQCELTFGIGSQVCPYLVSENQTKSCLIYAKKFLIITGLGIILS